jgi:hypothetical protein
MVLKPWHDAVLMVQVFARELVNFVVAIKLLEAHLAILGFHDV